jgi:hypothetical protein
MLQLYATHTKLIQRSLSQHVDVVNYPIRCAALKREMKTMRFGVMVMCVEVC